MESDAIFVVVTRVVERINGMRLWQGSLDGDDSNSTAILIPSDLLLAEQRAPIVLKTNLAMMFLLSGDGLLHLFEIGLARGKIRVAALPLVVGVIVTVFLQSEQM